MALSMREKIFQAADQLYADTGKTPPCVRIVVTVFCNPQREREAEGDERCRGIRRS